MLGFGGGDRTEQRDDESEEEVVTVVWEKELDFDYTEHDGVAHFDNGETAEFTFDKMEEVNGAYVLSDYTGEVGERERATIGTVPHVPSRKFVSIPQDNLNYFETTERRGRTLEDTEEKRQNLRRSKAEAFVAERDDAYIEGDSDET